MKYWFRGKRGGLFAFALVALLVAGGLGWVTADALHLEQQQQQARLEAERLGTLRVALWRLDSRMVTAFVNEANRPYQHFGASDVVLPSAGGAGQDVNAVELKLQPEEKAPPWLGRQFLLAANCEWNTTRELRETMVQSLGIVPDAPASTGAEALAAVAGDPNLRSWLTNRDFEKTPRDVVSRSDRDSQLRYSLRPTGENTPGKKEPGYYGHVDNAYGGTNKKPGKQASATLGPLVPFWLTGEQGDRLAVGRTIRIGPKIACHLMLLDWPALQVNLAEHIRDLFPKVRFLPVRDEGTANLERMMTSLPLELDPGTLDVARVQGWTPLRFGLALAWGGAVLALVTVGLGGWSLLDLSERRIRFVSTVTHELRTPLTTLRFYLDMLTSGVVREERQKAEYLQTLHEEADRLHRLIGNVLDFSRLENQRPRLEKSTMPLGGLLEQVRSTWVDRCQRAGMELVVENLVRDDLPISTDVQLVYQILGNLIDNACKYAREAGDNRISLRASGGNGRLALEVEDHGPGVAANESRSIFRPFHRARGADATNGGVGLGLALAQRWAGLLRGKLILCKRKANSGACFRLELPADFAS